MTIITATFVPGIARTKGSLNFHGQGRVSEGVKGSKEWRVIVRDAVYRDRVARFGTPVPHRGPVAVHATYWLEGSSDGPDIARFDTDKLCRNVGDALADPQINRQTGAKDYTKRAIENDNMIIRWDVRKLVSREGGDDPGHGMMLIVWEPTHEQIEAWRREEEQSLKGWRAANWGYGAKIYTDDMP